MRYHCVCPAKIHGLECETDLRPCNPNPCEHGTSSFQTDLKPGCSSVNFNRFFSNLFSGRCAGESKDDTHCVCDQHWEGNLCGIMKDYCSQVECLNGGRCRKTLGNWSCECMEEFYYGERCEITRTKMIILSVVSKSFAFVAILAVASLFIFVIVMDFLKYVCGIDPARQELMDIRRKRWNEKRRFQVQRFIYYDGENQKNSSTA